MIDLRERGKMYPPFDFCVDARALCDAIAASDVCEPAGCSLKFHFISVRDRMAHGLIREFISVDARDMLADGLTKGGIDRLLLHRASNDCVYGAKQLAIPHTKAGIASSFPGHQEVGFEHRTVQDPNRTGPRWSVVSLDQLVIVAGLVVFIWQQSS